MTSHQKAQRKYDAKPEVREKKRMEKRARRAVETVRLDQNQDALTRWHRLSPEQKRERILRNKYGMTPAEWDALFESQGRRCALCKTDTPGSKKGWSTDHCHKTQRVRGILCPRCNIAIGWLEGLALTSALEYLSDHAYPKAAF